MRENIQRVSYLSQDATASSAAHREPRIAVIIPCYKVTGYIIPVLESIGSFVERIYVVDDACPQGSGRFVEQEVQDARVVVLYNKNNIGVGGAVKRGFSQALQDGFDILVKLDGDGQMNPADVGTLIKPLVDGHADYTKGNRFFSPRYLAGMPRVRLLGNAALSFLTKISSGYWHVMDPTNGFLAIHSSVFQMLEQEKIDDRYFFETDLLCSLHLVGAVVQDVPIPARYGLEVSNLRIRNALLSFSKKHFSRAWRRLVYEYFVRDFNVGSAQLLFGLMLFVFGTVFGGYHWLQGVINQVPNETGTIMLAALPTIIGFQLLLSALNYDIARRPVTPVHRSL